jgi:hypothetical protein
MIRDIINLFRRRYLYKSAITGRFVTRAYAEANPATTVRIRIG